jgi:CelD/BcsL family acetyltransferase involved in cellulose biosynthesis
VSAARPMEVEEIRDPERFHALETPWNRLLAESAHDLPFLRHEWLRVWWKHFGREGALSIYWVTREGVPVLAAPLYRTRDRRVGLGIWELRSMTNEHSFRFDILLRRGETEAPAALWRHLSRTGGWDLIEIRDVVWPEASAARLLEAARADGHPTGVWLSYESPYLAPRGPFEGYRGDLKPKFRSNLRNRIRRLGALGALSFETLSEPEPALAALPTGLALEGSGWKQEEGSAIACDPTLRAFYTEWAALSAERGWLRLHFLSVGGRAIAFDYSLLYGGRLYCLKMGYDPGFASYSAGQLLKHRILEQSFSAGVREYDFLGPMMEAKADWHPSSRRHAWLFLYALGVVARLAHAEKFRLRPAVKRLLNR